MDGTINNKYLFGKNIGSDSRGTLFSMEDTESGRAYYTELIRIDENKLSAGQLHQVQYHAQQLSRFSHTNAISIYPPDISMDGLLIRQNEIEGQSLADLMSRNGRPLPYPKAKRIARELITVMAALHSEGLVHGALSPSSVLIDTNGKVYLSFLPLPPIFDTENSLYHEPGPAKVPNTADDIYALGIIFCEIFTNLPLFRTPIDASDAEEVCRVQHYYEEGIPQYIAAETTEMLPIIQRCIAPNPRQRFANAEELYWAFTRTSPEYAQEKVRMPKPRSVPEQPKFETVRGPQTTRRPAGKKGFPIAILLSIFVFLAAAGFLYVKFLQKPKDSAIPEYRETLSVLYITQTYQAEKEAMKTPEPTATYAEPTETPTATPEPTATAIPLPIREGFGAQLRWKADNSLMASVPQGSFTMGQNTSFLYAIDGTLPRHRVRLDSFWMDETEVTLAQYTRCVEAGVCEAIDQDPAEADYPVRNVTWDNARDYCTWVGKRLPTEAEWEKAARGDDRRLYPWGNTSPDMTPETLHAVGTDTHDISPYGILDMGGNVSEWTVDFFSEERLITADELVNPIGPLTGNMHTVKGGAYGAFDPQTEPFVFRRWGSDPLIRGDYGFRCVVSGNVPTMDNAEMQYEQAALAHPLNYSTNTEDCTNMAGFREDITIPDGSTVTKGEKVTKTWLLENVGTCVWNENYKMVWADENLNNPQKLFDIGVTVRPGEQAEISVDFEAQGSGLTRIAFLLADSEGNTFGLGERGRGQLWIEYNTGN